MMTLYERRQTILRLLREQPGIKVTRMAGLLDVSEGTIRNDLTALEEASKLRRVRGGAILLEAPTLPAASADGWDSANNSARQRLARWAAEMVEDGDTIMMDASSTVGYMVPYLAQRRKLTVVTNGLKTAQRLAQDSSNTVILVGGRVSGSGNATISLLGAAMVENLHARTAFVSAVGFDLEAGLTERNIEEAQLKQAMLASARRVVALVDSSKVGQVSTAPFAALEKITHVLTDGDVSPDSIGRLHRAGVNLVICGENTVRSYTVHDGQTRYTIGFANQSEELPFAVDVRRGLERAVNAESDMDLVVTDNKLSGEEALRVADRLIQRNVDLAIEYQIDEKMNNLIMDKFQRAAIPVIAVDIPIVGATFFGVDNYRSGHMAGVALGQWLATNWDGYFDKVIILEEPRAGSLPAARIQGQLDGLQEVVGLVPEDKQIFLDSGNTSSVSEALVYKTLQACPDMHRFAVICFNDDAAIGALRAARALGRESDVVIVGQGADRLVRDELRQPDSRIIGSTAFRPEQYGQHLLELALKILRGESVPPAVFIDHVFINAQNISRYYPEHEPEVPLETFEVFTP
jgi:ribose transport system substrate-binding protein